MISVCLFMGTYYQDVDALNEIKRAFASAVVANRLSPRIVWIRKVPSANIQAQNPKNRQPTTWSKTLRPQRKQCGIWDLKFFWNLELRIWDFLGCWSLGFGIWSLGFGASPTSPLPYSSKDGKLQPFLVAVHVLEPYISQPLELNLDSDQLVRWVLLSRGNPQRPQKPPVQLSTARRHMLQVAEDPSRDQRSVDLRIKRLLPFIGAVMNGKARYDHVKAAKIGQRLVQVVCDHPDPVVAAKPLAGGLQHGGRKVERHPFGNAPVYQQQRQQPAIPGSQIKDSPGVLRNEFEQSSFAFHTMRNPICATQILQRVLDCSILI